MTHTAEFPEGVQGIWLQTPISRAAGYGVYVFRAGPWLIDAGFKNARRALLAWPGLEGASGCLLTHHDEDHTGNAAQLAARGFEVLAPSRVIERLQPRPIPLYRRLMWGTAAVGPVGPLGDGLRAEGWRLDPVYTPGHSADHYAYHEPDRDLVFSADLYIGRRVPVARPDEDLPQLLASLRRVRNLNPRVMFCAHRGRIARPAESLQAKIDWLEEVISRARELARGGLGVAEIGRRVLGRRGFIDWVSFGEYSRRNLIELALRA
ncbi:MAG: MBL fold metallo-hydrolase [Gemmatimonadota bacterium]